MMPVSLVFSSPGVVGMDLQTSTTSAHATADARSRDSLDHVGQHRVRPLVHSLADHTRAPEPGNAVVMRRGYV
jgi:hypothetical protein